MANGGLKITLFIAMASKKVGLYSILIGKRIRTVRYLPMHARNDRKGHNQLLHFSTVDLQNTFKRDSSVGKRDHPLAPRMRTHT